MRELQPHTTSVLICIASGVFGTMKFLSTRVIGKEVHPSSKTIYLGIISILLSFSILIITKPSYFYFWSCRLGPAQIGFIFVHGFFAWLT